MENNILDGLNDSQKEAVTSTEGFIRVIAGAGSGKTRALSHRFAYLVLDLGIMPSNILCVTFTNKSANEMRQRIRRLTGDNDTGYISTFHGFCVSVLQEDSHAVSYPKSFLVLDNSDIDQILKIIYDERGLTLRNMTFSNARDMIEIRKGITDKDYYEDMIAMSPEILKEKYDKSTDARDIIFYGYLYNEKKCFGLDYNDLIFFTQYIFRTNEDIKLKWQKRLEYIMIDEFQDIDEPQYELMQTLCGYHKNLFIVGDPDQTIYTWRGASVKYLLSFSDNYPTAKTIMMTDNYRSTPEILRAANSLISKNEMRIKKELTPVLSGGQAVRFHHSKTDTEEAEFIVSEVGKLTADGKIKLSDITILYRAHYVTRTLEEVFLKEKLPYTIYSGVQFYERKEIKDALAYLRLIAYRDDLSFMRVVNVPKRNMGEKRMKFLKEYARKNSCSLYDALSGSVSDGIFQNTKAKAFLNMVEKLTAGCFDIPVSELLGKILHESGYEEMMRTEGAQDRLDNLAELRQGVHDYEVFCGEESILESYLSHVALMTNNDRENDKNAVKMMTVHAAKGLEFPYVFLVSMDEGIFPSKKTSTIESMEEERRLAFVALTRAKKGLYLTDCEGRTSDGSYRYPSRFIFDIDRDCIQYDTEPDESLIKDAQQYIRSKTAALEGNKQKNHPFDTGDRIDHRVFGKGTIIGIDCDAGAYIIKFDNMETSRNISFRVILTPNI